MNPFQSPLCVSGGCAGYDSGLRAHGRFRCPVAVSCDRAHRAHRAQLPVNTYRRTFQNVETGHLDATGLLNKANGKNRESENPEEISLLSGRNPTVALEHRGERFETENRQRRGEVAQAFVNTAETTRPRRVALRGLALRREPQELAVEDVAPHMILSPEPFSVHQS